MSRRRTVIPVYMLSVSVLGFALFYLFPFLFSLFYALMDSPLNMQFAGLKNFVELLNNQYFMRGLKNTAVFMLVSIPLNMILSLAAALMINRLKRYRNTFSLVFLIPLVIPSATTAFFWENIFSRYGILNRFLDRLGITGFDWFQSRYGLGVIIVIFVWKNVGYNMALFISGLNNISSQYYECAAVEGAGGFWQFRKITMTYLAPTAFLVLIMTIVNSFKVFKEIYIITGQYPPDHLYMLQHYMNNMFLSLNYPRLASAIYILTVVIVLLIACLFRAENLVSENLSL